MNLNKILIKCLWALVSGDSAWREGARNDQAIQFQFNSTRGSVNPQSSAINEQFVKKEQSK